MAPVEPPRPGPPSPPAAPGALEALEAEVVTCTACPRLVAWRRAVADRPRPAHLDEDYWARPVPGFGDPSAWLLLVGLAPAAHGGNRTGRMFTGDRSGDFLFAALHRAGIANQAESHRRGDGLRLTGAFVTAAVRCAPPENRPLPDERRACSPFLAGELGLLASVRVVLALGAVAYDELRRLGARPAGGGPAPRFAHGLEVPLDDAGAFGRHQVLVCSYHPSQRNVFTGLLTPAMLDAVLARAADLGAPPGVRRR